MLGGKKMSETNKSVLDEQVNPNYSKAVKEIAALLTFLPEEDREKVIEGFLKSIFHA
jgi:MinD-like ATPase involved in chromosome partitioning or flagellar assembly